MNQCKTGVNHVVKRVGSLRCRHFVFDGMARKGEKKVDHDTETLGSLVVHCGAAGRRIFPL
jgi:hypothetical protein